MFVYFIFYLKFSGIYIEYIVFVVGWQFFKIVIFFVFFDFVCLFLFQEFMQFLVGYSKYLMVNQ